MKRPPPRKPQRGSFYLGLLESLPTRRYSRRAGVAGARKKPGCQARNVVIAGCPKDKRSQLALRCLQRPPLSRRWNSGDKQSFRNHLPLTNRPHSFACYQFPGDLDAETDWPKAFTVSCSRERGKENSGTAFATLT
ncbi:hypothetical protein MTO96_020805 [Rhipicephalus appendiculatus]